MSILTAFSMYFLSFVPLWISILFIDIRSIYIGTIECCTEVISISIILIAFTVSLVVLLFAFNPKDTDGAETFVIVDAKEEKTITAEFLLSYILPLFAFDFTVWHEVVLFLIFFTLFAYLCIRHNHFSVNIMLELMGYRFYACELQNTDGRIITKTVISQKILTAKKKSDIRIRYLNNEFCVQIDW